MHGATMKFMVKIVQIKLYGIIVKYSI